MMYGARFKGDKLIGGILDFADGKNIKLNKQQDMEFQEFIKRKIHEDNLKK